MIVTWFGRFLTVFKKATVVSHLQMNHHRKTRKNSMLSTRKRGQQRFLGMESYASGHFVHDTAMEVFQDDRTAHVESPASDHRWQRALSGHYLHVPHRVPHPRAHFQWLVVARSSHAERRIAGHTDRVTSLSTSRDGLFFCSTSYDGTARLWNFYQVCVDLYYKRASGTCPGLTKGSGLQQNELNCGSVRSHSLDQDPVCRLNPT